MKKILSEFHRSLQNQNLVAQGARVLLAVSGGVDSMALLKLFVLARKPLDLDVRVAHLDHALRRQSAADARFVEAAARREGVKYYGVVRDVKRLAKAGKLSVEEAARNARYEFLFETARKTRAAAVATAHTMDDQAETVFMRLLRGAGLKGLGAIPAAREERGVALIRPLLRFRKSDLKSFLRASGTPWREDLSNESDDFFRNRIRNRLLPRILKDYGPQFDAHLVNLAEASREAHGYIESEAASTYRRLAKKSGTSVVLSARALGALHPAILSEVLFLAAESVSGTRREWTRAHLGSLIRLVRALPGEKSHNLPHRICALRQADRLRLFRSG